MKTKHIKDFITPVIESVQNLELRQALQSAFETEAYSLSIIEDSFNHFASQKQDKQTTYIFMRSWNSMHLKMLPIYGLTCRLQKLAMETEGENRDKYFMAAGYNAETSYEDLNLEKEYAHTHSELYEKLAKAVCGDDAWRQDHFCITEAADFRRWIYYNMVAEPIEIGLLTNLFSEIFNHGEYAYALQPFEFLLQNHCSLSETESQNLSLYIRCHVDDDVEEDHFYSVIKSLEHYNSVSGQKTDFVQAEKLFRTYLKSCASVMAILNQEMKHAA